MFPHERTQRHLAMDFQLQRIEEMADMKDNSPFCVLRKESRGDLHTCRTFSEHVRGGGGGGGHMPTNHPKSFVCSWRMQCILLTFCPQ